MGTEFDLKKRKKFWRGMAVMVAQQCHRTVQAQIVKMITSCCAYFTTIK